VAAKVALEHKQVAQADLAEDQVGSPAEDQGGLEQQGKETAAAFLVDHQTVAAVVAVQAPLVAMVVLAVTAATEYCG
jgi:hypothetical protein